MLVDSHCHLDFPDFADEVEAVVARARAAGVERLLTINTHLTRASQVIALTERFPEVYGTVGVHPHEAGTEPAATVAALLKLAEHPKIVGFGETGLDYFYDKSPRDRQRDSFRTHIAAARQAGLPVIVHTRDADQDTVAILREELEKGPFTGLIHCFSSGAELAKQALEMGFYLSLSGIITFKKAEALQDIVRDLPLERLLVETDSPYLAPIPYRGKRNEPAYVAYVADKLAALKGVSRDTVEAATSAAFFDLFRKVAKP